MWKQIRMLLGRKADAGTPTSEFDLARTGVEAILQLDVASDSAREAYGGQVLNILERLNAEIERVRVQAGGYPATTIAGDVWFDGVGYANLASALTQHFKKAGWLKHEHNASLLWAKATLAVCSHYHHLVGPAMIANADCHERLGNAERAAQMYTGVVQDFSVVLDGCDDDADAPTDDDRIAIESLRTAVVRLLAMGENEAGSIHLAAVLSRADEVLSRETTR